MLKCSCGHRARHMGAGEAPLVDGSRNGPEHNSEHRDRPDARRRILGARLQ